MYNTFRHDGPASAGLPFALLELDPYFTLSVDSSWCTTRLGGDYYWWRVHARGTVTFLYNRFLEFRLSILILNTLNINFRPFVKSTIDFSSCILNYSSTIKKRQSTTSMYILVALLTISEIQVQICPQKRFRLTEFRYLDGPWFTSNLYAPHEWYFHSKHIPALCHFHHHAKINKIMLATHPPAQSSTLASVYCSTRAATFLYPAPEPLNSRPLCGHDAIAGVRFPADQRGADVRCASGTRPRRERPASKFRRATTPRNPRLRLWMWRECYLMHSSGMGEFMWARGRRQRLDDGNDERFFFSLFPG